MLNSSKMKKLVVFYSRSGNTRKAGELIAAEINADIDEIKDKKKRDGIRGFMGGGFDAFKKRETRIEHKKNPAGYGLVVVGTPIWAGTMAPAIRSYLKTNKLKNVAFFSTAGSGSNGKAFREMEGLSGKPVKTLELREKIDEAKIKEFSAGL